MKDLERIQSEIEIQTELNKLRLKESFYRFVKAAFRVLHPGQELNDNWHVREICAVLQAEIERIQRKEPKTKDIIINIPPRSLKSFICTVCLPAWSWTLDARMKFIGTSYSDELSTEHNVLTRRIVESDWYQGYWGETVTIASDQNQKRRFETTVGGLRRCTSTGGTITGGGGDVIIVDDPINPMQAASEADRLSSIKYFDETLTTRLNDPEIGIFIIVMQRLHEVDLTGHLLSKNPEAYAHYCIPARLSDNVKPAHYSKYYEGGLFFPGRFNEVVLKRWEVSLGSYGASGQLGQRPSPEGGGILKKSWFKTITYPAFAEIVLRRSYKCDIFADTAYTDKTKNDPSALMAAFYCNKNIYILNVTSVWLELPELVDYVKKYLITHNIRPRTAVRIEPKASGKSLRQTLKKDGLNAIELPAPTDDKVARAHNVTPVIEAERVFLVDGAWIDGFLGQCAAFPNGAHDDEVDCLVNAVDFYTNQGHSVF